MTKELLGASQQSRIQGSQQDLRDPSSDVAVYVDNLAAQTGLNRFLQVDGVYYAKTPVLDSSIFRKTYRLIYPILEPHEVTTFIRINCPSMLNNRDLIEQGVDKWRRDNNEIKCVLPNKEQMYCSIIDTSSSFRSVNLGGPIERIREDRSVLKVVDVSEGDQFSKTRVALHTTRCGVKSKFNPIFVLTMILSAT